jgi:hypothetical protein
LLVAVILAGCLPAGAQHAPVTPAGSQGATNIPLPYWANDRFDSLRFVNDFTQHFVLSRDPGNQHTYAFFPPTPPALESEIPVLAPLDSGPAAAPELSAFVGDVFYPFLGVRLAYGELLKSQRVQILAYRNAKVEQQDRIRAEILRLKDADPKEREAQLAALASQQAPRIAELEAMAEAIRTDLRQTRVLGVPVEYTDLVEKPGWRKLAAADQATDPAELRQESNAVRAVAFYQEGLSAAQRHLLFGEAIELEATARAVLAGATPGFRMLSFSPEGARIRLPANVPEALEGRIALYLSAKRALRLELRDTLRNNEDALSGTRADVIAKLAVDQAPRLAALEAMAEEIRSGVAGLPDLPGPPTAPSLPPELTAHITTYRAHKVELLRRLRTMLSAPTPVADPDSGASGKPDPVTNALAWMHDGSSRTEVQSTELRVSVGEFDRLQTELISQLNREENVIREELAAYARSTNGPSDKKSINDLLRDFEDARQRQEIWGKYRDYRAAVLMPGLSPGQRRLLFDAGVEQLSLPLPAGEKVN